ncbi:MAG: putative transmembrane protein [Burkholderiaceae bacterium]|jgi:outer membrane protein assembly factor BamC|nr:MAG: putative transmembrane protein [Burkholderiaceae bacterium]
MKLKLNRCARPALLVLVAVALSACSSLQGDKVDYKSARSGPGLDVPPDLTQLAADNRYAIPGAAVTASGYQTAQTKATSEQVGTAPTAIGDMHIERDGNDRWLVVNRPADKLWEPVREFWQENGFLLTEDDRKLGVMETDWAENHAKLPQDIIRRTIGKVFGSLYDTGERDRFRTRLERAGPDTTDIYITHQGMVEVYTDAQKTQTIWEPRPPDPGLEAIFLRRLMIRLGATEQQAKELLATAAVVKPVARVTTLNNQPVLQMGEDFERAWRRVGLTLDRAGFTVEDRDRSKGLYYVRYVDPTVQTKEPGFFAKMFGASEKTTKPLQYRIALQSQGNSTTVSVQDPNGAPDASANAKRIVQVIADDLN